MLWPEYSRSRTTSRNSLPPSYPTIRSPARKEGDAEKKVKFTDSDRQPPTRQFNDMPRSKDEVMDLDKDLDNELDNELDKEVKDDDEEKKRRRWTWTTNWTTNWRR